MRAGWKVESVNLNKEEVVFIRLNEIPIIETKTSQGYGNLNAFLNKIPREQEQLALSFDELGKIIGRKLPPTAFQDRPWWANTNASPQGSSWTSAGWRVTDVYLGGKTVVFRRKGENLLRSIPRYVKHILNGSDHLAHHNSQTLIKWIRFCRKIGWHFEGTVLYEKGGLVLNALSEIERLEVEEDYAICKRQLTLYQENRNR